MTSFRAWLENTNIAKETDSNGNVLSYFSEPELQTFIQTILKQYFGNAYHNAKARYDFTLKDVRDGYSEVVFQINIIPKGGKPEQLDPSHEMHQFYKDGRTGKKIYKSPKEAVESIPVDPTLAYRGMSWEEWQFIRKNGYILSNGGYNLQGQENLTFFGPQPDTGEYYANGFAPMAFQTSLKKPSVVIAIPRNITLSHKDSKHIPQGELAVKGKIPQNVIRQVWILSPTSGKPGVIDFIFQWVGNQNKTFSLGKMKEGSRFSPSVGYALKRLI